MNIIDWLNFFNYISFLRSIIIIFLTGIQENESVSDKGIEDHKQKVQEKAERNIGDDRQETGPGVFILITIEFFDQPTLDLSTAASDRRQSVQRRAHVRQHGTFCCNESS